MSPSSSDDSSNREAAFAVHHIVLSFRDGEAVEESAVACGGYAAGKQQIPRSYRNDRAAGSAFLSTTLFVLLRSVLVKLIQWKRSSQGGKLNVWSDRSTQTWACSARSLTTTSTTNPLPGPGHVLTP